MAVKKKTAAKKTGAAKAAPSSSSKKKVTKKKVTKKVTKKKATAKKAAKKTTKKKKKAKKKPLTLADKQARRLIEQAPERDEEHELPKHIYPGARVKVFYEGEDTEAIVEFVHETKDIFMLKSLKDKSHFACAERYIKPLKTAKKKVLKKRTKKASKKSEE